MKTKKLLKIITGIIVFLTLPSLLFFGFLYFKYNKDLPSGVEGKRADDLATEMLIALNYDAFIGTDTFEWTYKKRRHYVWNKNKNTCEVLWKDYKVVLDLVNHKNSKVYIHGFTIDSDLADDLKEKALNYYKNDSFWVFAPYNVFEDGAKRELIDEDLLVTYASGDAYLWKLDNNNMPKSFKMWNSELPIDGLEASWSQWTTTETGAQLPTFHQILFFGIEITDVKGY